MAVKKRKKSGTTKRRAITKKSVRTSPKKRKKVSGVKEIVFMGKAKRKRRSVKKRSVRRAVRLSGSPMKKSGIMDMMLSGAGVVTGVIGGSFMGGVVPVPNAKLKALIPIALGFGIGMTKFGKKGFGEKVALGSVSVGMLSLTRQFFPKAPLLAGAPVDISKEDQAMLGLAYNGEQYEDMDGEYEDMDGEYEDMDGEVYQGDEHLSPADM